MDIAAENYLKVYDIFPDALWSLSQIILKHSSNCNDDEKFDQAQKLFFSALSKHRYPLEKIFYHFRLKYLKFLLNNKKFKPALKLAKQLVSLEINRFTSNTEARYICGKMLLPPLKNYFAENPFVEIKKKPKPKKTYTERSSS